MALSSDLVSQFAKAVNGSKNTQKTEKTVYGTIEDDGTTVRVRIDGSDKDNMLAIPIDTTSSTTAVKDKDRVTVMIKNHNAIVTGNLSDPSATKNTTVNNDTYKAELSAVNADIANLKANKANVSDLTAIQAQIDELDAGSISTEELTAIQAQIDDLDSNKLSADDARITYATIAELNAAKGDISVLNSEVADIDTLIFGSATGNTIQASFSNAVIAQLGNAQIKSAMIDTVSADKITAGDIITNDIRVLSEDGKLLISDETIQISDNSRVRVQIGKDSSNDYSINVWDQNGNLMFSKGGITDSAIKDSIIRNDMVSDTANIAAHKLDIDSLFDEINESSKTIKSTKVYLDDKAQTLDVAFKALTSEVTDQGYTISSLVKKVQSLQEQINELRTGA